MATFAELKVKIKTSADLSDAEINALSDKVDDIMIKLEAYAQQLVADFGRNDFSVTVDD